MDARGTIASVCTLGAIIGTHTHTHTLSQFCVNLTTIWSSIGSYGLKGCLAHRLRALTKKNVRAFWTVGFWKSNVAIDGPSCILLPYWGFQCKQPTTYLGPCTCYYVILHGYEDHDSQSAQSTYPYLATNKGTQTMLVCNSGLLGFASYTYCRLLKYAKLLILFVWLEWFGIRVHALFQMPYASWIFEKTWPTPNKLRSLKDLKYRRV